MIRNINKNKLKSLVEKKPVNVAIKRLISSNNNSSSVSEVVNNKEVGAESTITDGKLLSSSNVTDQDEKTDKSSPKENKESKLSSHNINCPSRYKNFPSYNNSERKDDVLSVLYEHWKSANTKNLGVDFYQYEISPYLYLSTETLSDKQKLTDNKDNLQDVFNTDDEVIVEKHCQDLNNAWNTSKNSKKTAKLPYFFKYKVVDWQKFLLTEKDNKIQAIMNSQNFNKSEDSGFEGTLSKLITANTRLICKEKGVSLTGLGRIKDWDYTAAHIEPKNYIFKNPKTHIIEHEIIDPKLAQQVVPNNVYKVSSQKDDVFNITDPLTVFQNFVSSTLNQSNLKAKGKQVKGRKRYTIKEDNNDPKKKQ